MINQQRLSDIFTELVQIDSVSREEKKISERLKHKLSVLQADEIIIDNSREKTGSDTGNMIVFFKGTIAAPVMMLSGHMDTVEPGRGVKPRFEDGIFKSDGTTILGADDKSALAIIIEVLTVLRENNIEHGPIEVVFTVCEELGLLGARYLDTNLLKSRFGYILDSTDAHGIVTRAPFANYFQVEIFGKAAHAGAEPENGLNALHAMAKALAMLNTGRIDHETTCNFGVMQSGKATNIVPEYAILKGEVRSHRKDKLDQLIVDIENTFNEAIHTYNQAAKLQTKMVMTMDVREDFPGTDIPDDHQVVKLAKEAAANLQTAMETKTIGGGADANIFFNKGIVAGVLGTGMKHLHSTEECIALEDMVNTAGLVLEIIRLHSETYKTGAK